MVAYTSYPMDLRVQREAETLISLKEYEVLFLVPKEKDLPRNYVMNGVNIIEFNMKQYQGKGNLRYIISYVHFMILSFITCTKLFFTRNIDVFHFHNMPDFLVFAAIIPRLLGKKVILDIHDTMPETYAAKFDKKSRILFKLFCIEEAVCCKFAHKIICVNHIQRNTLVERGIPDQKIAISMNVPDHKKFNYITHTKTGVKNKTNFKLVYHGTVAKRLGIDFTIRAVSKLVDKIPGLEFYIFGGGGEEDILELIELSKRLEVNQYVHFNKFVPMESLLPILGEMHLGVVSYRDNMATALALPVKMLEYVFLNIPVVAPRLKTIQYYFTEEMVSYFEPENVNSLASVILELYNNELKREKQAQAASRFIEKYGWEKHQASLINLYKELAHANE